MWGEQDGLQEAARKALNPPLTPSGPALNLEEERPMRVVWGPVEMPPGENDWQVGRQPESGLT